MNHNEGYIQIDATVTDIVLDDLTRPHIYVASDKSGQLLTAKYYAEASRGNTDDFIDHTLDNKSDS